MHTTKTKVNDLWVCNFFGNDYVVYVGSWGLFALSVPHAANFATLDSLSLDDVDPDACWWAHLLDHVMSNSVPPHLIATAIDCNLGILGISYTVTNFIHVRSCYYLKTLCHFTDLNMGEHTQELFFNMKKCTPGCLPLNSSGNYPIIISWNSSKSMVPDPSSSTSSTMWSRSSSVKVLSISLKMSFSTSFVMNPWH